MANLSNINNKFLVTTGGNVGINVTSPTTGRFVVNTTSGVAAAFGRDGTDGDVVQIYNGVAGTTKVVALGVSGNDGTIYSQYGNLLLQTAAGNVGIGTVLPGSKLEVTGNVTKTVSISQTRTDTSTSLATMRSFYAFGISQFRGGVTRGLYMSNVTDNLPGIQVVDSSDNAGPLSIQPYGGNVGIGTTSPGHLLQVKSSYDNFITKIENDLGSEGGNGLWVDTRWNVANNVPFKVTSNSGNSPMMIIKGNGAVGIGITDPSAKLEVKENLYVSHPNAEEITFRLDNYGTTGTDAGSLLRMFNQAGTTVVNIDSRSGSSRDTYFNQGGNVGIGTTSPGALLDLGNSIQDNKVHLYASGNDKYGMGIRGSQFLFYSGGLGNGNGGITFGKMNGTTYTENMRVTNDGNVGIGATSPGEKLTVSGNGRFSNGSTGTLTIKHNYGYQQPNWGIKLDGDTGRTGGYLSQYINLGGFALEQGATYYGGGPWKTDANSTSYSSVNGLNGQIVFYTNTSLTADTTFSPSERMRITGGGEVLFGTQGTPNGTSIYGSGFVTETNGRRVLYMAGSNTAQVSVQRFYNPNGQVGEIKTQSSSTLFVTSSDYRLKEDLQDFNGLDKVSKIPVYDFKWKSNESRSYGVMAHELQEVLPDAVSGEKDAEEMQGVDYSKIVPLLVKSIQELKAEIELLKSK